ncbi:hypothetical protein ILUMI_15506 [Ignelater luminosus]|uniref:Uncharacterized protein n=1 Tax=Ignelater luminosus TaxID=2038154 RepID=A0A8K0G6T0_IGNLU|nr:hypothetical protein ILUMI_15506 [Ignelater luminosus]
MWLEERKRGKLSLLDLHKGVNNDSSNIPKKEHEQSAHQKGSFGVNRSCTSINTGSGQPIHCLIQAFCGKGEGTNKLKKVKIEKTKEKKNKSKGKALKKQKEDNFSEESIDDGNLNDMDLLVGKRKPDDEDAICPFFEKDYLRMITKESCG